MLVYDEKVERRIRVCLDDYISVRTINQVLLVVASPLTMYVCVSACGCVNRFSIDNLICSFSLSRSLNGYRLAFSFLSPTRSTNAVQNG